MDTPPAPRNTASLTEIQRQYLRLVADGMTSKQIAQRLGGSHHTVNVQIGFAMRILGATSRHQAAVLLDAMDDTARPDGTPPGTDDAPPPATPVSIAEPDPAPAPPTAGYQSWPIPIATLGRPSNTMTMLQRIAWVLGIATAVALLLGGLVSGIATMLTSLGRLG